MLKECLFKFEIIYSSHLSGFDDNLVLLIGIENHLIDNGRFIKSSKNRLKCLNLGSRFL